MSRSNIQPAAAESVVFSFGAECAVDIERLKAALPTTCVDSVRMSLGAMKEGLQAVELFASAAVPMAAVLGAMRVVPDSHVMLQTLRPVALAENSLQRDWDQR